MIYYNIILVIFISFFPNISAHAAVPAAKVPKTGQATCYKATDTSGTTCGGTGQDGENVSGVSWPDPRFVEAGIRVNDRLIALYGLLKTSPSLEKGEETTPVEVECLRQDIEVFWR